MIPLSILDLTPVRQGGSIADTFREAVELARAAERLGFHRYWLVEHHNTPAVAGAATAVLMAHIAAHTSSIRIGAGGIMLPNHAPLMVAEQFGTLAALYPDRIDLGLGRGINNDPDTLKALRRQPNDMAEFPQDVEELLAFLRPAAPGQKVRAIPGAGTDLPVWILGSSAGGADLAARLGLPFAYASHFSPDALDVALATYRGRFKPSAYLQKPRVMLSLTVVAADTDEEARLLFSSAQAATDAPLPPPVAGFEKRLDPKRLALIQNLFRHSLVGGPATIANGLAQFVGRYRPDEVIAVTQIFDPAARARSFELLSAAAASASRPASAPCPA